MNLTQPSERFDTLADAEDALKHQGFTLVANTCDWIDEAGLIDAGVYAVEGAYGVSKFRIEYRTLKGKRGVMAGPSHTPVDATSRRRFLTQAAGVAAGSAVLALATIPPALAATAPTAALDPVFGLIAAHREAVAVVRAMEAEATRQSDLGIYVETEANDITEPASAELGLFVELTETVPTTLAGVVALVTYLDEINKQDPWKFEDNYATPLIGALATAFNRMAVAS
jgi:hypothetical protein